MKERKKINPERIHNGYAYRWAPRDRPLTIGKVLITVCEPTDLGIALLNAYANKPDCAFFQKVLPTSVLLEVLKAGTADPENFLDILVFKDLLRREKVEPEVAYCIGDRFLGPRGHDYILGRVGVATVSLINLATGDLWHWGEGVSDPYAITGAEFNRIAESGTFTRTIRSKESVK